MVLPVEAQQVISADSANETTEEGSNAVEDRVEQPDVRVVPVAHESVSSPEILQLSDLEQSATTIEEWSAQIEASLTQITAVRVETTEAGLQILLDTAEGTLATPATQTVGNALIAEIPNAVLALPEGGNFEQFGPVEGIALVSVTNEPGGRVRVAITGTDAPPVVAVTATGLAVTLGEAVVGAEDEAIQVVVTGEQDEGYNPSSATTATRTDTPLRDIPQSIQVVPRQVLEDRNVQSLTQAVETVAGVVDAGDAFGAPSGSRTIRGFRQDGSLRNGLRDAPNTFILDSPIGTVEQVEVLRGPASVLFGALEPGGVINVITRQPLDEPYYNLAFEVGNRAFYQPSIDLSGPLTDDDTVLYRFIAAYQWADGFQKFVETNQTAIAPSITFNLGERTRLNTYYEYADFSGNPAEGYSILLSDGSLTPRDLYIGYPNFASFDISAHRFGYTLTHELSENWQIRNNFAGLISDTRQTDMNSSAIADDRFVTIDVYDLDFGYKNYFAQIDLLGEFRTGSISHQILIGFDFNNFTDSYIGDFNTDLPLLDIRDPNYDVSEPDYEPFLKFENQVRSYGVYLQDQIDLSDNLILLIGGRYDWVSSVFEIGDYGALGNTTDEPTRSEGAFSPRIGLVYQPSETVSLYTSYSRSFRQESGFSSSAQAFEPTRGTQYEVGVKADFLDSRLSTTLAAYHLTRTNVTTSDPDNPQFSIQTGEQRSQGIELNITGEILPGWNMIASYAYTDAIVTEDNDIPEGNRLTNVPENQASLWTTYEIQEGDLRGLGFGLGLFYVGERQGDLANSFQLDDYLRTDAALYYRRDRFSAAINVRNLFDTDYARNADGPTYIRRGAPFTIVGSVSWTF
ncbi:TonB-dependent siderophore receptor [Synechococcales cyanobacterium C]|uniref:TonB-dependent siderophore receptor n=2 Tax=Petrachloros TaxID=2918834 RepID=A0A8K2A1T8_9CYAN|nr:TonB-dependent siderophore receptor [Petrachloros mirabilis ULC683]